MIAFQSIAHYSSAMVIAVGLASLLAVWGLGTTVMRCVRLRLPSPWNYVCAILLGIQVQSLAVQLLGMVGMATISALMAAWWGLLALGLAALMLERRGRPLASGGCGDRAAIVPAVIVTVALAANLIVALAPSSKADEIYYHMLVPSRIVMDGALHFYLMPWQAAIWPTMVYQIAATPTYAMGYPDAANVVSWGLAASLAWFTWTIIRSSDKPRAWAAFWTAAICVGAYPVVWHTTAGAHAMGDLAMAAAVVAWCSRERLLGAVSPTSYTALISILALSAASSKFSLLPLSALIVCISIWPLLSSSPGTLARPIVSAAALPWLVLAAPIMLWTWSQSGSPFGPMLTGLLGPSAYPAGWADDTFRGARLSNQRPPGALIQQIGMGYSLLVWLGAAGAILGTRLPATRRMVLSGLLLMQVLLIAWLLPPDPRFLGGLHYGMVIVFACFSTQATALRIGSARVMAAACLIGLLPWVGLQAYFARQFLPVVLGLEKTDFLTRSIAFLDDYVKLDTMLDKDAVVLVHGFRASSAYAPRPIFFHARDLPKDKRAYLLVHSTLAETAARQIPGYRLGRTVYDNPRAATHRYRTPGRAPVFQPIQVMELIFVADAAAKDARK